MRKLIGYLTAALFLTACGGGMPQTESPTAARTSPMPAPVEAATAALEPSAIPGANLPAQPPVSIVTDIPAFPGAEGFGAAATGGRGGRVIYVTTLDPDPGGEIEGSLNWALAQQGPRIVLFQVSGVINGPAYIRYGDVTIAGQTSPGGAIVRGLICDDHYEDNDCRNIIIRHIRSRPAQHIDNNENVLDDGLRLDGVDTAIVDHVSVANAVDEAIQISWSQNITIQNTILAETVGEHFDRGGMLINYSHSTHPQNNLTIVRNMWHRIGGRMPELDCELSGLPDQEAEIPSFCAQQPLNVEISNNLLWDPALPMWYNAAVDPGGGDPGVFTVNLNYVNNYAAGRPGYTQPMVLWDFLGQPGNALYVSGNMMNLFPGWSDYQLFYCCNDFNAYGPNTDLGAAQRRENRHDFPPINYIPADQLTQYVIGSVGALPRDAMDTRYIQSVMTNTFDLTPLDTPGADDALTPDFDPDNAPAAPQDSDGDGMPDEWEAANGLDPNADDHNGVELSAKFTGVEGYTNVECYVNWLSDRLVSGAGAP